jgi:hypothetical protein
MCWTPQCANKHKNNVNKISALLQTTAGKDELNMHAHNLNYTLIRLLIFPTSSMTAV